MYFVFFVHYLQLNSFYLCFILIFPISFAIIHEPFFQNTCSLSQKIVSLYCCSIRYYNGTFFLKLTSLKLHYFFTIFHYFIAFANEANKAFISDFPIILQATLHLHHPVHLLSEMLFPLTSLDLNKYLVTKKYPIIHIFTNHRVF